MAVLREMRGDLIRTEKVVRAIDSFMWIAARDWPTGTKLIITQLRVVESTIVFNLEPEAQSL